LVGWIMEGTISAGGRGDERKDEVNCAQRQSWALRAIWGFLSAGPL
jgi:hypothetical protein